MCVAGRSQEFVCAPRGLVSFRDSSIADFLNCLPVYSDFATQKCLSNERSVPRNAEVGWKEENC
jgi:hypothetical protein